MSLVALSDAVYNAAPVPGHYDDHINLAFFGYYDGSTTPLGPYLGANLTYGWATMGGTHIGISAAPLDFETPVLFSSSLGEAYSNSWSIDTNGSFFFDFGNISSDGNGNLTVSNGSLSVAGPGRFDGPVRIEKQGDLDMGEFTNEPSQQQSGQNFTSGPSMANPRSGMTQGGMGLSGSSIPLTNGTQNQ